MNVNVITGIPASPGVAIGPVLFLEDEHLNVVDIQGQGADFEVSRLNDALLKAKDELKEVCEMARRKMGDDHAAIFEAHLMMLDDPELRAQTEKAIRESNLAAQSCFKTVTDQFIAKFEALDSEYLRARAADIRDLRERVLRILMNVSHVDLSELDHDVILVAKDLTPSQTATMNRDRVKGFITEMGGKTSHSAIMARTLEIPAIVGVKSAIEGLKGRREIVIDGDSGQIVTDPTDKVKNDVISRLSEIEKEKRDLLALVDEPSRTLDGKKFILAGNIGSAKDVQILKEHGADGVGLFRTEFLYMDRNSLPTEEEQFKEYSDVLRLMGDKGVVIRTLDIGGDKELPYLKTKKELNPFLGNRAIRLCLRNSEIFKTQLRALLRASQSGRLQIMFPMISNLNELLETKALLLKCREELEREGYSVSNDIEIGIMIEVPSAALCAETMAKEVDFFSVGTNDLIQYTLAVDRMNETISDLYDPYHPAIWKLIQMTCEGAKKSSAWVGMCGEVAGMSEFWPLLVGMGLKELSMNAGAILKCRRSLRKMTVKACQNLANQVLAAPSSLEVKALLNEFCLDSTK